MADKDDVETINPTMESEEGATAPETPSDEKPEEEKKGGIVQKVKDFLDSKIGAWPWPERTGIARFKCTAHPRAPAQV